MTRCVLFDTETTGLDPLNGDRIIEFAAVELHNDLPTGRLLHRLIDPQCDIAEDAQRVHGISRAQLHGKPVFAAVADEILAFFDDSPLIAHNAAFDFGFINAELARIGRPQLAPDRMIDTLALARLQFPGLPNSLDALCRRFAIDLSARTTHNALLDCRLLADVYVELTGGRQRGFTLAQALPAAPAPDATRHPRTPLRIAPTAPELAAHAALLARMPKPIWLDLAA